MFDFIRTRGAKSLHSFVMTAQTLLSVANFYDDNQDENTQSSVYRIFQTTTHLFALSVTTYKNQYNFGLRFIIIIYRYSNTRMV